MPTNEQKPLADRARPFFPADVRSRGAGYFHSGSVKAVIQVGQSVEGLVVGTRNYRVHIKYLPKTHALQVGCTCPYSDSYGDPCKHLWAALLAADQKALLQKARLDHRLHVVVDITDDDSDLDGLDEEQDDEFLDSDPEPPSNRLPGKYRPITVLRGEVNSPKPSKPRPGDEWKKTLQTIGQAMLPPDLGYDQSWTTSRQIVYVIDIAASKSNDRLIVEVGYRQMKQNGQWGKYKSQAIPQKVIDSFPEISDREILGMLVGAQHNYGSWHYQNYSASGPLFAVAPQMQQRLVAMLCHTGRCHLRGSSGDLELATTTWGDAAPWTFKLHVEPANHGKNLIIHGSLHRGQERMELSQPQLITSGGVVFTDTEACILDHGGAFPWIAHLRRTKQILIPRTHQDKMLNVLLSQPSLPPVELPEDLRLDREMVTPRPRLMISKPQRAWSGSSKLEARLHFDYDGVILKNGPHPARIVQVEQRRILERDRAFEQRAAARLRQLGFDSPETLDRYSPAKLDSYYPLAASRLTNAVLNLTQEGWHIEAEGKLYVTAGSFKLEVRSGIDWFELHGQAHFGNRVVELPVLLQALHQGEKMVMLDDGTMGMIPEQWLKQVGALVGMGETQDDHVRFGRTQVGALDALLAAQPEISCDEQFSLARKELQGFAGILPVDPPPTFTGALRPYQREGLGWLHFLQQFSFGGCLADDMGLGKTIQVLALLEERRQMRPSVSGISDATRGTPSLVVVPRSLIFNWKQEAARFTPQLRILDHSQSDRVQGVDHLNQFDVVLTTYGTLRRDASYLKDVHFDYVILDESQFVKNGQTESAKAVRLLRSAHRLAMTGTPVENHLGELWSLFDFLNPGMLGKASAGKLFLGAAAGKSGPPQDTVASTDASQPDRPRVNEAHALLAHILRPFILRRTKEQVAKDLPAKVEQTLWCELRGPQRDLYDQLRDHYRQTLLGKIDEVGMNKSRFQVLEALLRLRQAACHPGLVDKARVGDASAKIDSLLPQLEEVIAEGHKALVFSQFTSLLAIVKKRLDERSIEYEYLEGKTNDRQARVERFQNDPSKQLFLISLKAGGVGLNLTAAGYVFILDPWWNPAVEAQAVDRTHRIGQTRQVFAYRLIARGTVEEKVLELQRSKRDLADAIINAENSLVSDLKREDLELLLS